ncbi:hypothetical protein [Streptomyces sp. NPDC088358]|uniref:hypothetical protein n=1 Tax=Streptomyces sp. NPDC088358 TaxID=3365857 RepID=UPI00382C7C37
MRRQRQTSGGNGGARDRGTGDRGRAPIGADPSARSGGAAPAAHPLSATTAPGVTPQALLALQRTAGNAATARALRGRSPAVEGLAGSGLPPRPGPAVPPTAEELPESGAATRLPTVLPALREEDETGEGTETAPPRPIEERSGRPGRRRPGPPPSGAAPAATHVPLGLPPYLRELRAPGLSTAYRLTGHEFVSTTLGTVAGRSDGTVAEIREELAGRPETFYGQGRSFTVEGPEGKGWYDVTVTVSRDSADLPETFVSPEAAKARGAAAEQARAMAALLARAESAGTTDKGKARAGDHDGDDSSAPRTEAGPRQAAQAARVAEGAGVKVDTQHNTSGAVSHSSGRSAGKGVNFMAFGLAPVVPGVWLGGAVMANAQPFLSSRDTRVQKAVSEPRVLRSDKGSVEIPRRVRYGVRIKRQGEPAQTFGGGGTLMMRVPTEHLVPVTAEAPAPARLRSLDAPLANRVRLADSLAPIALDDAAAPEPGGGGLFDTVSSVLHPSLTSPGAPGRARLHDATSTTTLLEDLPRLLGGWVMGEDLVTKDGSATGSYRMRADLTGLAPSWTIGGTQLRTHQQAQHSVSHSAGKGRGGTFGAGPAAGFGALGGAAAVRGTVMPTAGARKARFTVAEQTVSSRQGAEVRGDKVLYFGRVRFRVEGTGPLSPAMRVRSGARTAHHSMDVWVGLRADEAQALGLARPEGVTAGPMVAAPVGTDTAPAGTDVGRRKRAGDTAVPGHTAESAPASGGSRTGRDTERHLPFGAMGSSVTISQLDTVPLLSGIERLFAADPRLAGYLPSFGPGPAAEVSREEAEVQRRNYRELVTVLSETNLRVNKDQLLSSGIRVRMRRKSRWHAHDVQIRVVGALRETGHLGDTKDWLVRSHSGVTSNSQSGRSSSRSVGGLALGQFRLVPGVLSASVRGERTRHSSRRNQAGPTTRTDVLTNGGESTSSFGGALRLDVDVTMTARERTARRALTPGAPGRDAPEAEHIASSADTEALASAEQDVRLLTPTAFTLDTAEKDRLTARTRTRTAGPGAPQRQFSASGIGDLSTMTPRSITGRAVRDWTLVETLGDGGPVRDLAFQLLSQAAARGRESRADRALQTEGLAPRLAIEERFSPQAITSALRQAVSSGWVVKNLRHPRRLAALDGAVGTRLALVNPEVVAQGTGPGTETFVLGGHQVTGQEGRATTTTVQGGLLGAENGAEWRIGEGLSAGRSLGGSGSVATTLSGSVERNAHTPRSRPLYLVHCDLVVRMVAEVKVTGGGPYVATGERTLPATAALWLTGEQVRAAGLRLPGAAGRNPSPAVGSSGSAAAAEASAGDAWTEREDRIGAERADSSRTEGRASGSTTPAAAAPTLAQELPLGFGMIEELPDFVPLLERLRTDVGRRDRSLADALLPRQQLADPNDNMQRLLRVLDRDGSAGLLSGAMDGGVPVELFRGRGTPYWAVFRVRRTRPGTVEGEASDGRDMEYITSAAAQRAHSAETRDTRTLEGVVAGAGKPEGGGGPLRSVGASGGLGVGVSDVTRSAAVGRGQLGVKTVAEASARSVRMRVPIEATLELHSSRGRVGLATLGGRSLVHRVPAHDLEALSRLRPVPRAEAGQAFLRPEDAAAGRLGPWHARGVSLPMEAQVNGFRGAPEIRRVIDDTVRAAHGGERYRRTGDAAAYAQREAVSTEWLISALPLLTAAGADLPVVHASGVRGQDLRTSLHARLRDGRVLGVGDKMTFETVAQSSLDAPRPTGTDHQQAAEHGTSVRGLGGAGVLNADEFRMNQFLGHADRAGGATDAAAHGSGSMPLHKPKAESTLVQFTLDVRVVARVSGRGRSGAASVAVRDLTLPVPVVVRMPAPLVRHMLRDPSRHGGLHDPDGRLASS